MYEVVEKLGINISLEKNKRNLIKFVPSICLVNDEDFDSKVRILQFHRIHLTKLSHIKILGLSKDELQRRIAVAKSNNLFVGVINDPSTLLDYDKFTLKKRAVQPLKKIKVLPLYEEKAIVTIKEPVLEKGEDIFSIIENSEPSNEEKVQILPEEEFIFYGNRCTIEIENILKNKNSSLLNEEMFMKFEELSGIVNGILQTLDYDLLSKNFDIDDNVKKLLLTQKFSDLEILLSALSFGSNLTNLEYAKLRSVVHLFLAEEKQLARVA